MKEFYNAQFIQPGEFIIEEYPTSSATADDIEAFALKKAEEISNKRGVPFKFDNIYINNKTNVNLDVASVLNQNPDISIGHWVF